MRFRDSTVVLKIQGFLEVTLYQLVNINSCFGEFFFISGSDSPRIATTGLLERKERRTTLFRNVGKLFASPYSSRPKRTSISLRRVSWTTKACGTGTAGGWISESRMKRHEEIGTKVRWSGGRRKGRGGRKRTTRKSRRTVTSESQVIFHYVILTRQKADRKNTIISRPSGRLRRCCRAMACRLCYSNDVAAFWLCLRKARSRVVWFRVTLDSRDAPRWHMNNRREARRLGTNERRVQWPIHHGGVKDCAVNRKFCQCLKSVL